ncbi:uncharacterized protein LOC116951612 isoform X2 [Petromyzon marinus]|uniref:uncharacterized protein LOC116951612 isoform X2 n=1 Tax=Petromyzon marinus TaxID=7757 RepID=UPI003F71481E
MEYPVDPEWRGYFTKRCCSSRLSNSSFSAFTSPHEACAGISSTDRPPPNEATLNTAFLEYFHRLGCGDREQHELDVGFLSSLIGSGANVNTKDQYGQTALHTVAQAGHLDAARFLVERGARVGEPDTNGRTPLHVAATLDHPNVIDFFVKHGGDVEAATWEELQTAAHYAAKHGARAALECLYRRLSNIHARDYRARTPLFLAAKYGQRSTVQLLLSVGADAGAEDSLRTSCLSVILDTVPDMALLALNQLRVIKESDQKQYFYLRILEPTESDDQENPVQSLLELVVMRRLYEVVDHPVVRMFIDVKWNAYGLKGNCWTLTTKMAFIVTWMVLLVAVPWPRRHVYTFPEDWWRVALALWCVSHALLRMVLEARQLLSSRRSFAAWKELRYQEISSDRRFCHPCWPEESIYLENQMKKLRKSQAFYFLDYWNVLDWVVLLALLAALVTHVADVIGPSAALARTHVRLAAVAIVPLWMCNLKQMRSFWVIGPFIVMLGKMAVHFFKLLFLLLQFFVPYSIAFLLVFHNSGIQTLASGHMTAFQVLRLGFTDEYEALAMLAYAPLMTPLLVVSYVGLVSIVCLNIFVAMLNDAYESVSEDPRANMYMQRASVLLGLEKSVLFRGDREVTRRFLHNECSPLHAFYGHERAVQTEFELLTAACEIQDGLEELWEYVHDDHTNGGTKEMSFTTRPQSPRSFPSGSLSSVCQEVLDIHWQLDLLRMEQRDTTAHLKYMLRNLHQRLNAYTPIDGQPGAMDGASAGFVEGMERPPLHVVWERPDQPSESSVEDPSTSTG